MKKCVWFLSVVFLLSLVFTSAASAGATLKRILKRGELVVGTTGQQPPMNATSKQGTLIGLDIDLATRMAEAMGVKIKFDTMDFADLLSALEKGKTYDSRG